MYKYLFIIFFIFSSINGFNQNVKNLIKEGQHYAENDSCEKAMSIFSEIIQIDPQNESVYLLRAKCYLAMNDTLSAAKDYRIAAEFNNQSIEYYNLSAKLYYQIKKYTLAEEVAQISIEKEKKNNHAWITLMLSNLDQNKLLSAGEAANLSMELNNDALTMYYAGVIFKALKEYEKAEKIFEKAIVMNGQFIESYLQQAEVQIKLNKNKQAIENSSYVLSIDSKNEKACLLRAIANYNMRIPDQSINDLTKLISLNTASEHFLLRGDYHFEFGQYTNAIQDYSVIITRRDKYALEAYQKRALSYEKIGSKEEATGDYKAVLQSKQLFDEDSTIYFMAKKKLYDLNFELNKPGIHISKPVLTDRYEIPVEEGKQTTIVNGIILDENIITSVQINNKTIPFDSDSIGHASFSEEVSFGNDQFITLTATDIYGNESTISHPLLRIERESPIVSLLSPISVGENIIRIDKDDKNLYIEGNIIDRNTIKHIRVNNTSASYNLTDLNPRFTATINIENRNSIAIAATDKFNNTSEITYKIVRDNQVVAKNPMGKNWVVIIENSEYKSFPNLSSTATDAEMIKKSLAGYQLNNVMHKKNLTKRELERFFAIDLRDLIRNNKVQSLMIYYTGHGAFINETGYWIPADARIDEEFDFYNLNALKASLYSYTNLKHLLVVSDACDAGPSFNVAMKGEIYAPSCLMKMKLENKSAQALTSTKEGYALDNSQFATAFTYNLDNNTKPCISIEELALKVIADMKTTSV
ncbi:MAG: caspase family protein, partial [Bacteroidales bacterium]|nr:caspase family protein [Bacteroidales bacterium]